jgi:hypothetical protein
MKLTLCYIVLAVFFLGCKNGEKSKAKSTIDTAGIEGNKIKINTADPNRKKDRNFIAYHSNEIEIKDVLINRHAVILPNSKFNSLYKEIDSSKTSIWEYGDPFEWLDAEWMKETYGDKNETKGTFEKYDGKVTTLSVKDIKFDTNKHIVLFNTAYAKSNSFEIPSHHIVLNQHTSEDDFKKMFPNSKMEKLENSEALFRFSVKRNMDDAFLFYFKNGKLNYFSLWWLLC